MSDALSLAAVLALAATLGGAAGPVVRPASNSDPEGKVGKRPYELDWANRHAPAWPQLVDFEDLSGWQVTGREGCVAHAFRSREELLFGTYTAKVVYRGRSAASAFELRPPQPIPIPGKPTAVEMWVRGNNWGWHPKPKTARTRIHLLVRDADGKGFAIYLGIVNFDYWSLMHATFVSPAGERTSRLQGPGGMPRYPLSFCGIRVSACSDPKPARLFFDALQFYEPAYKPLPELKLPPSDVPWPTTPETITPTPKRKVTVALERAGEAWVFTARGHRDTIRWTYTPRTGSLADLVVEVNGRSFKPCDGGGPVFLLGGAELRPGDPNLKTALTAIGAEGDTLVARWLAGAGGQKAPYLYRLRAVGKSLQLTARVEGTSANAFLIGHTASTPQAELIRVPYLTLGGEGPHVVRWEGVFLSALLDWYNSDASELFDQAGRPARGQVVYNGGSRYLPKTDGRRNPLRERLIVTVSSDFQEVLPNIPHPRNPMAHLATGAIWRNVGAPNRDLLARLKARGVEGFICPLHEVGWRDAGESFTFRLRCAPRIGDDEMKRYGQWVKGLGYRFGLYANYTDYAPVNGNWDEDKVCLRPDGNWTGAWPRCYAPKPTYAWQAEAHFAPRIAAKFGANTCYSDVHTCVAPWGRTDYDTRAPGAGMFRAAWRCYARLLWNECQAYQGPVFSEGRMHWMYAGLVTGNYAQITGAERWRVPPIVDFDLLKLHPRQTDFGMGMPSMFYDRNDPDWRRDRARTSPYLDRFLTSTIAFGHIGFLPLEWGFDGALKAFYLTNALQQRYALVPVAEIRYFDGEKLLTTSEAIRTGAYKRGQLHVRYRNGLRLWCNLSFQHDWRVTCDRKTYLLPPTGHLAFKKGDILQLSGTVDGHRVDYVDSADYCYLDTRDEFAALGPLAGRGAVALKPDGEGWLAIPLERCDDLTIRPAALGLKPGVALSATALGLDGKPLGHAEVRASNIGHTIMPVEGAVRYRIAVCGESAAPRPRPGPQRLARGAVYRAEVEFVNTGRERLGEAGFRVEGPRGTTQQAGPLPDLAPGRHHLAHLELRVPRDARPGERLWYRIAVSGRLGGEPAEGTGWFTTLAAEPLAVELRPEKAAPLLPGTRARLVLRLTSNIPGTTALKGRFGSPALELSPGQAELKLSHGEQKEIFLNYTVPEKEGVAAIELAFEFPGGHQEARRWLKTTRERVVAADLARMAPANTGIAFRGKAEEPMRGETGASFYPTRRAVGGVAKRGFFCHPPYKGGVGYAFADFELALPDEPCLFEASVGFADGSTTHDGCVFTVKARPVGEGDFVEVATVRFAELKKWKPLRADLSRFAGRRLMLRLVTDVGPADNSTSDWALWGEPRVVLAGERLVPRVINRRGGGAR